MYGDKKQFTRITFENSYGHKQTYEYDREDVSMEDILDAFYGLMVGATWCPLTILHEMKEFAEDKLEVLEPRDKNDEE